MSKHTPMILAPERRRQNDSGLRVKAGINLRRKSKTLEFETNKYKKNSHL